MKKQNKYGFTLIELVVVITIIGILSAVLIPNVIKYVNDAKISAAKADAVLIEQRVEMMFINESEEIDLLACGTVEAKVSCPVRLNLDDSTGKLSPEVRHDTLTLITGIDDEIVISAIASLNNITIDSLNFVPIADNTVPNEAQYVNADDFTNLSVGDYLYSYHKDGIMVLMQFNNS